MRIMTAPKFKTGDKVTFTNEYGVVFTGKTITKLDTEWKGIDQTPRYFYTPSDSPWFSVSQDRLSLEGEIDAGGKALWVKCEVPMPEPSKVEPEPTCKSCRFWKTGAWPSDCLRHAPGVSTEGRAQWPTTQPNDWCGDFEPSVQPLDAA
ncbi:hypothetical protein NKJ93_02270 [Mesorhizobium sp. M0028]|uniref:hypothetical protein n=1 Tax=Mesorhizobium sp. M0028 TaxID=2956849 RepID=UPI00333D3640